ncbi:MAG TPA: type II toxin-antitoxin system VapC family toxin [Burkholderiales bacterium]|nr:type II toxin-antitoxin system VapC family toxin [Burkholderiales bacterium]
MKPRRTPRLRESAATYLPDAFVIDCSVCVPWYLRDEASQFCDQLGRAVHHCEVWVTSLWRPELVSAMVNAERRRRMTRDQRREVLKNAHGLPLRIDHEMPSVVELNELAAGHDLSPYDAVYFELARRRKLPLATLDAALVKAARAAKLPLITDLSVFPER